MIWNWIGWSLASAGWTAAVIGWGWLWIEHSRRREQAYLRERREARRLAAQAEWRRRAEEERRAS